MNLPSRHALIRGFSMGRMCRARRTYEHSALWTGFVVSCLSLPAIAAPIVVDADVQALVLAKDQQRISLIEQLAPAVVCVYDANQRGGGSGVLIDADGHGLTNFHVIAGTLPGGKGLGGLSDGRLYELEVLGIDPTGDVAMFRLRGQDRFPFVSIGDSDEVRLGESVMAMGNPFVLSEDYTPSVTAGIVTGVHRYQWGSGSNLVYSDCIQVDASINPGNSGGPLFDRFGRLIGINGRISVNMRGRFNVGLGYAISINQIKRFMPSLRAGLLVRHGTLQANAEDLPDGVVFTEVLRYASAYQAGVRVGHRLVALDNIAVESRNHLASLIGTYPAEWPVLLRVDGNEMFEAIAYLEGIEPKVKAFAINDKANAAQVEATLQDFRNFVWNHNPPDTAVNLRGSILREAVENLPDTSRLAGGIEFQLATDRRLILRQCPPDERAVRYLVSGDDGTHEGTDPAFGGENGLDAVLPADVLVLDTVPREERLYVETLRALALLMSRPADADVAVAFHGGGTATFEVSAGGSAVAPFPLGTRVNPRMLQVVRFPVGESGIAAFHLDTDSKELRTILVTDQQTDVTIRMDAHGATSPSLPRLPEAFRVSLGSRRWIDWYDWSVAP